MRCRGWDKVPILFIFGILGAGDDTHFEETSILVLVLFSGIGW